MRKPVYLASRIDSIVCPSCGIEKLSDGDGHGSFCGRCDLSWGADVTETLKEIAALPDALGNHACECGHPEMRRLPDGIFHCPSCRSEVLPIAAEAERSA